MGKNPSYRVVITRLAEGDLVDIYTYIASCDSTAAAELVLNKLEEAITALANMPMRGVVLPEMARVEITDYREVFWKSYRVIYQVVGKKIHVLAVLDGRRDLQDALLRRLLRREP